MRSGNITDSRSSAAQGSGAAISAPFELQPAVQDIAGAGGPGNLEAQNWGWTAPLATGAPTWVPIPAFSTKDGAEYREISTEIYLRNLGLSTY